ncbi:polysaccharide export protein [Mucilaginibacter pallidiroseus]|uniref:Polysaccharide export protein n=1 Tax=Mucilaginibacter pallidiroseus TaxID=2599295 RepID=A0A563U849_9SPHI|nr:polysaccharide biosynthesis/export family protein [Mucilaginibacter pallidiroseus]TWR27562.1 polysaccharide export protein [Mucilaginibacter pallidiroseus]
MKKNLLTAFLLMIGSIIMLSSCGDYRKIAYFNNIKRDSVSKIQAEYLETKISRNDLLQINITTLDERTTRLLNGPGLTATGQNLGYLVDDTGLIRFPYIGDIKAAGLTKNELSQVIAKTLVQKDFAKDPIVVVRISNYKITVLGEVTRPGIIPVPTEHITLPEALASAGDLTQYGKRNNVLLIREVNGERIYKRFSLNGDKMFDKDLFNLQNQDIIYVEPNNAREASGNRSAQLLPYVFSTISLLLVIYSQFIR